MLHVGIYRADNRSSSRKCTFYECAAQSTTPDPLDAMDPEITLGNLTNSVSSSIRAAVVDNDDLVVVSFQNGLKGEHQSVYAFDFVERRYNNCYFECCAQLGIVVRVTSRC